MNALRAREGITARTLEFAVLTTARPGEVRWMRWNRPREAADGVFRAQAGSPALIGIPPPLILMVNLEGMPLAVKSCSLRSL